MNATKTISLVDFANDRSDVCLFWTAIGTPMGDTTVIGHPDLDFADRRDLFDLEGTVDEGGDWHWDGDGEPTDDRGNSITKLHAYASTNKWAEIVAEYEGE